MTIASSIAATYRGSRVTFGREKHSLGAGTAHGKR